MRPTLQQAPPASPFPPRWRGLAVVLAVVLLVHAGLLLNASNSGHGQRRPATSSLQVRQLVLAPAVPAQPTATPAHPALARDVQTPAQARASRSPSTVKTQVGPSSAAALPEGPALADAPASGLAAGPPEAVPVYATRPPASLTLRYALRRGALQGHAELQWQLADGRYQLVLRSDLGGAVGPGSASIGQLDAHGLAPERHTESRRGRELRAVNFQRDSARVTFSGPRTELPLLPGAQDRLSWLLQLAAIAEASPELRVAGQDIRVHVVGTRGDAEVWHCTVLGREDLDLPAGPVAAALHLRREPQRLYDTQADVWLDPARQHLPVRVEWQLQPSGMGSVWLLEGVGPAKP